jgi:cold-inducible RNA-binding protein
MKNLFVGNMTFQTSEGDLKALFEPYGQVARVHIAIDRETRRSRGFGFVEMPNDNEAAAAMQALDGKDFGGRQLKVNEARPREASSGPPRGGSRGGPGGDRGGHGGQGGQGGQGGHGGGHGRGGGGGRGRFSNEDYSESPRQPREPRW